MSVTTVGHAIAEVQRDIAGVKQAYAHDEIPAGLTTSKLPCFLNFPGEALYTYTSHSYVTEIREWRMQLYVQPISRDTDVARMGAALGPLFRRVFEEFLDSIQLESLSGVVCAMVERDTGWSVLNWGGVDYVGTEFILSVTEKWTVSNYGP